MMIKKIHGKGKFSPNGLKICVDYFAARGHTNIKIFMPLFRQEQFSSELLTELKTKCDVVFTPSQCINGQRRTPYDDRFIVQYATEFGGVIVSTDNYRDISTENVRWRDTIAKRLLMFTWVDDFLMFPVDPLGRSGPTLEEFLRF
ncbi:probable ribonuclease ZC3H12D isoform X2 [Macrosteles quadrilineatus]|uniref:probable ribonuclease ZC3H12D isoform X2 n=1 Tax=Macrosteles quadrilineatus TaxID=74068 RepID=UPI0023E32235|nr:probable ribonuclease ZC3H12D isoform X2 [Macrosteles quadrilineatus]